LILKTKTISSFMNLHSVLSSFSSTDIQDMLGESYTFRRAVSEYLTKNKTKPKKGFGEKLIERLKREIRRNVPGYNDGNKIAAIKYFRGLIFSEELKKELKKLGVMDSDEHITLSEAKKFIERL